MVIRDSDTFLPAKEGQLLTCDKCGAKGFITLEGDEFHCHLCGFVWYLGREAGKKKKVIKPGLGGQRRKDSKK
jgi:hypothetical protein